MLHGVKYMFNRGSVVLLGAGISCRKEACNGKCNSCTCPGLIHGVQRLALQPRDESKVMERFCLPHKEVLIWPCH